MIGVDRPADAVPEVASTPAVTVVVVVYGDEPVLPDCLDAILASTGVDVELVVVENGGSEATIAEYEARGRVRVVRPGRNSGFAEGCNLGVQAGSSPFVALVNPDAVVASDALHHLIAVASREDVGIATASVRLADRPELLNSAGTELTFLGLSWAGHFEEPAAAFTDERFVAAASGAGMVCTRTHWEALGGLVDEFFAYFEDAEFSIRTWQHDRSVVYVPAAVITHRYEFSRNPEKFFLLERNRLVTTLTCFDARHLAVIAPLLLVMELALFALAAKDGWASQKVRALRWMVGHRRWVRSRRRAVQASRIVTPPAFYDLLSSSLTPGNLRDVHPPRWVGALTTGYWMIARRVAGL